MSVTVRGLLAAALLPVALVGAPAPARAATEPAVAAGGCGFTATPDDPPARPVGLPADPDPTPQAGAALARMDTVNGPITLQLDRAKAPCTVLSFLHLAAAGFYDDTVCHRLTAYPTLQVLQCGDPSATGEGGPGYKFKDELPTDLPNAPADPTGARKIYARGVLAMANAGPNTNGSQFFLVYGTSVLRPNYTIFGTVAADGLTALDQVAAGGIAPTADNPQPVDGAPVRSTHIATVRQVPAAQG